MNSQDCGLDNETFCGGTPDDESPRRPLYFATVNDLRQWVVESFPEWGENEVNSLVAALHGGSHPGWGEDWSSWLGAWNMEEFCEMARTGQMFEDD